MSDPTTNPGEKVPPRKYQEYEDPHYHDEDVEIGSTDEPEHRTRRPPGRRQASRRPPPRRHYEE
jgi:hypothetical protein